MWKNQNNDAVDPQGLPGSLTTYREAVDEFSQRATEFLEYIIPLLTEAREAYQRAMTVSTELRHILDTGDETLRTLMAQMEQAVNVQVGKPTSEKKKPEAVKLETINTTGETAKAAQIFP